VTSSWFFNRQLSKTMQYVMSDTAHKVAIYMKKRVDADTAERSGHFQHLL